MFFETVDYFGSYARQKADLWKTNKPGAFVAGMLAGLYIGLGMALIFAIGAPFYDDHSPALKLVMGASFGIALSLVIFAGSDLFTGNTMAMPLGVFRKTVTWGEALTVTGVSWLGNLAGAFLLALLVVGSGALAHAGGLFEKYAHVKMAATWDQLLLKGILCNTLVCLAVWTSARTKSDAAKLILIFWCLFGFIGTGYEHSVANMSLLAMILLSGHGAGIGWDGYVYNLFWVTLGNLIAGVGVMALPYLLISRRKEGESR
jgi:nitrite transporter NirC